MTTDKFSPDDPIDCVFIRGATPESGVTGAIFEVLWADEPGYLGAPPPSRLVIRRGYGDSFPGCTYSDLTGGGREGVFLTMILFDAAIMELLTGKEALERAHQLDAAALADDLMGDRHP